MNCPDCKTTLEEVKEEVDIGVGTLTHLIGYDCPKCGGSFDPPTYDILDPISLGL